MRAPLDKIALVEKYLTGKLTVAEQLNFIKALETDVELQQLVNIQKDIIKAVQRKALRAEIKTTIKKVNFWNHAWKWIIGGSVLIALIVAGLMIVNHTTQNQSKPVMEATQKETAVKIKEQHSPPDSTGMIDERIDFKGLKMWINPDVQTFVINTAKGSTIEGKEGTLIIVPSNAFIDENNQIVKGDVEFQLVEALKLEDMVLYNLGTTSNGKALGTGGMLHIDFVAGGKKVRIDPKRALYVEVPTHKVKEGMMVFKGKVENGKLNWVNPQSLKKYLVNIDFKLLDFLPPRFVDTVNVFWPFTSYQTKRSILADSLYYSLDFCMGKPGLQSSIYFKNKSEDIVTSPDKVSRFENDLRNKKDTVKRIAQNSCCGIDPLSIKTLKTAPYAKTFIATQEFAERIKELHILDKGDDLLKIYISNLGRNLSYADSLVATKLTGESKLVFNTFAKQGLTNIKDAAIYQDHLNTYYNSKKQEYKQAVEKQQYGLGNKSLAELKQLLQTYQASGKKVWSQQDAVAAMAVNAATAPSYSFAWANSGWVNIDCYLHLLDFGTEEVKMTLNSVEGTMEVYQWLNTIRNLTPLTITGKEAKALFPLRNNEGADQMKNTYCFAISKKDGAYNWFDQRYNPYETKAIFVDLKPSTISEIRAKLKSYSIDEKLSDRVDALEKLTIIELKIKEAREKQMEQQKKMSELNIKLYNLAFPCNKKVLDFKERIKYK